MEFGQIHHVEYYVKDLAKTSEFWGWFLGRLGYSEFQKWESGISFEHKNLTYIVFVKVAPEYQNVTNYRQGAGLNHIAFKGGSEEELKKFAEEIKLKGIKILKQKADYLCFEDANDFAVEIFCNY